MARRKPSGGYEVGYGKPPKSTQFKPGNKAARGPRKKRTIEEIDDVVERGLTQLVAVKKGSGAVEKMPYIDALVAKLLAKAMEMDLPTIRFILNDLVGARGLAGPVKAEREKHNADMEDVRAKLHAKLARRVAADRRQVEGKEKREEDANKMREEQSKAKPA